MGCTQKVQMFKCIPRNPLIMYTHFSVTGSMQETFNLLYKENKILSKSVYSFREKNNLLFCNMDTYKARKAMYEKSTSKCNSRRLQSLNPARKNVLKGIL